MSHMDDEMTAKRSSRMFLEDGGYVQEAAAFYRSRRNSRQEESLPLDTFLDANQKSSSSVRGSNELSPTMLPMLPASDVPVPTLASNYVEGQSSKGFNGDKRRTGSWALYSTELPPPYFLQPSSDSGMQRPLGPPVPKEGRPVNFGMVVPGVYRSSYPKPEDYSFIRSLHLKTIVTLVQRDENDGPYATFMSSTGIRHHVFDMKGTKKEAIPLPTMKAIIRLVLDRRNHPMMIHCNHGKHRTGCVVAVVRKVTGWELSTILDEYKSYAEPKIRDCDVQYISGFELSGLSNLFVQEANMRLRLRNFVRVTVVSFVVLFIWLLSGQRISGSNKRAKGFR